MLPFSSRTRSATRRFVPRVEALEGRDTPSNTYTVTNLSDSGAGSLRQAVLDANANPGADVIQFNKGLSGTIILSSGVLSLTDGVTVTGPGARALTVSGNNEDRILQIAPGVTATVSGLTFAYGSASGGGAIDNAGTLTLNRCTVTQSQAVGGPGGGGILNEAGATLTLTSSTLSLDHAIGSPGSDVSGGGLLNYGTATATRTNFTSDVSEGGGSSTVLGSITGGGIANTAGGRLTLQRCTFSGDQCVGSTYFDGIGGALDNNAGPDLSHPSTATVSHCTFDSNLVSGGAGASGEGGAIANRGAGSNVAIDQTKVTNNKANGGNGGSVTFGDRGLGAGIANTDGAVMTLDNSKVEGNLAQGGRQVTVVADTLGALNGAAQGGGILNDFGAALTVTSSVISGNGAFGGGASYGPGPVALGGGIDDISLPGVAGSTMTITASRLSYNVTLGGEGGSSAYLGAPPGTPGVGGVSFGGAIDVSFGSTADISGTKFFRNSSNGGDSGVDDYTATLTSGADAYGGAIAVGAESLILGPSMPDTASVKVANGLIFENLVQPGSGGSTTYNGDGFGGGVAVLTGASVALTDGTLVINNQAFGLNYLQQGYGGGVYHTGDLTVDDTSKVVLNFASTGGSNIY
jgi:hypothetical protein